MKTHQEKVGIAWVHEPPPKPLTAEFLLSIQPSPEDNFNYKHPLKESAYERANPNQPFYAKFQKRKRRK